MPADPANLDQASRWVSGLDADGGTEILTALRESLESPEAPVGLGQVIFITDGSVGNEDQLFAYIQSQLGNRRLFTVGIGSAPNSYFMRKAAQYGRGTFTYIGSLNEVQGKMAGLFAQLESPVLRNVRVAWPGPVESFPAQVPDLYAGQPLMITARMESDSGYANQGIRVSGMGADGAWQQVFKLTGKDSRGIGTLWARDKIASLNQV